MRNFFVLFFLLVSLPAYAEELREIRFGFLSRLSGDGAKTGINHVNGVHLALKEEEESLRQDGYKIKTIFEDYGNYDLKRAAAGAQKLITVDKVHVLFPYVSEDVEVVWPLGDKAKLPMIAVRPGGLKVGAFSPYLVRLSSHDKELYNLLLDYLYKKGIRKLAIIAAESGYYTPMTDYAVELWKRRTKQEPLVLRYPVTDVEYRAGLLKVKQSHADLLLTIAWNQSHVYRQAHELGLHLPLAGVYYHIDEQLRFLPKEIINGAVYPNYVPATKEFQESYRKEYGELPGEVADYAYDAVKVAIHCLRQINYKTEKLIECILGIKNFPGASGIINFTPDGDRVPREVKLFRVQDGDFIPVDEGNVR